MCCAGGGARGGPRGGAGSTNRGRGMVASGQFTVGDIKKMDDDFDFAATTASFNKMAVKEEAKQVSICSVLVLKYLLYVPCWY